MAEDLNPEQPEQPQLLDLFALDDIPQADVQYIPGSEFIEGEHFWSTLYGDIQTLTRGVNRYVVLDSLSSELGVTTESLLLKLDDRVRESAVESGIGDNPSNTVSRYYFTSDYEGGTVYVCHWQFLYWLAEHP